MATTFELAAVDYAILVIYFAFVLGVGFALKRYTRSSTDFYYGSRARSVPEYLKLRFDEKTRGFNAVSFAAMTVFSSGISMYAMGLLLGVLLGWDFNFSVLISALIVLLYILLGGLTSAIYNEVLQFFLIVTGFIPLVFLGLQDVGGWAGLTERLAVTATQAASRPARTRTAGGTSGARPATRWASSGSASPWASASCSPSATGPRTSS